MTLTLALLSCKTAQPEPAPFHPLTKGTDLTGDYDCPDEGTSLTWDNFGEQFFVDLCESCHNHENMAEGIPEGVVFDNEAIVWAYKDMILERMGFADQFKIPEMPPEDEELYQDLMLREDTWERVRRMQMLKEWLICTER